MLFTSKRSRLTGLAVVVAASMSLAASAWSATFGSLAQRLPAQTDTIVAINVEKIFNSRYAKEQGWREVQAENWAKRPQLIPPGVNKLLMGAEFIPSKSETRWEITLMDMPAVPDVKDLAAAEGGTIDRVWNFNAVATPSNAYFVPLNTNTLAVCTPGERSTISRWVRMPAKDDQITSSYIKSALTRLDDDSDVTMALDLEGAYSLPKIRRYLANLEIEELKGANLDLMAKVISGLKGLSLHVVVGSGLNARVVITFSDDTVSLSKAAKPLLAAVLKTAGMYMEDIEKWTFTVQGQEVRASGPLTDASFINLISVVQSPVPAAVLTAPPPNVVTTGTPPAATDPATASQRYFKAVSLTIDNLKAGGSMGETSTWWYQASQRIDKLPILNVDPALVEWGTSVSMKLKQLAAGGKAGQTSINARVAGVAEVREDTSFYDRDDNYHYRYHESPETARMRREAATQQKTQLQQQAVQILGEANGTRQKIRQEMTQKYNVEF